MFPVRCVTYVPGLYQVRRLTERYTADAEVVNPLITFKIEIEREDDGRWLAEVVELPGVLAYGDTQETAVSRVQALALRVIAERLEHGEAGPELLSISFNAA